MLKPRPEHCPNKESHLLGPSGYLERSEWAEEMRKTHKQERCPECGLWVIWRPKDGHNYTNQEDSHADSRHGEKRQNS